MAEPLYHRVLLKLSGEVLAGEQGFGIDPKKASYLAEEVKSIYDLGIEIGLIIGAGNIFRGMQAASKGMDRVTGDYLGMLATIMNAISVQDALEKVGCETRTLSAISVSQIAEPYIRRRAIRHLDKGRVVIVAGGTGNPFFTTDSAAALRATELGAEIVLKGTKVDGVYDKDPMLHDDAVKYENITFTKILIDNIRVMDLTAITLCKENKLPIRVFNINNPGDLKKLVLGSKIGTLVSE
ncbi:MAG: UMP kinase [Candidatus Marinimicrobia bacterium]|jgi:uridylate kinase|nr:UMP kinase [Candidatus Neomarinimicrobiota bacterium]MBT3945578.1 UMP kinase [Candidatus Neomarinimicrobiota bacterium]MBT4154216.1 UMP kinase [Candidatus Neomarinimicrobiota bacterium]MBT4554145.1 UMP kinase [Candidatus Neomarinimicrobiota bacterium]MBT4753067.1 UMP kinase [Candidatus Neomarinimicrobiota bacterium]|tara:strand:+ start:6605 stop:7321 length:717 start_codon:yes stop_codon:yes gene_type:complete